VALLLNSKDKSELQKIINNEINLLNEDNIMKLNVQYGENIIVGVKFKEEFDWFVTEKDYWYLDLIKLENSFLNKGYMLFNQGDYSERFDIPILNEKSAATFLNEIKEYKVNMSKLNELVVALDLNKTKRKQIIMEFVPSLFIDFDSKLLLSLFPEPASFEEYVPNGWSGIYEDFLHRIPLEERYWMINGQDVFNS